MTVTKKYYTVEEIAKLWKLTPRQVRDLFPNKLRVLRRDMEKTYRSFLK